MADDTSIAELEKAVKTLRDSLEFSRQVAGDDPDLCINRGSSCIGSGGEHFSHVPKALGLPVEIQANLLRASFGETISEGEAKQAG